MKELPIIFSAPMVRAILDGRKTQTRRIVNKPIPVGHKFHGWIIESTDKKRDGCAAWSMEQMSQQCGKCKWWDKKNAGRYADDPFEPAQADCKYPTPYWVRDEKSVYDFSGENCIAYEERKECEE